MKKKLILPFEDHPYSLMYHFHAFPMGIIQGTAQEDITPWLCCKYINCTFDKDLKTVNRFTIGTSDIWAVNDKILLKQRVDIKSTLYYDLYDDVVIMMRKMIAMGCYPHGMYNEEYIPGKWAYQTEYFLHDFILIGYNDISQEFTSTGYLRNRKFQRYTIPYKNMEQAIKTVISTKIGLNFWRYNPEAKFELNLDRLISELSDYLQSTTSMKIFSDNKHWGMEAIQQLSNLFKQCGEEVISVDNRYTRGLMEHKFYMQMRIEYLLKKRFLADASYFDKASEVYKLAERVHLLCLKYNMTRNFKIISHVCELMNDMLLIEKSYLPDVLTELQNGRNEVMI